ncbi:hypothetical protein B0H14DRAFT_2564334 [Mycena olivaceomarginata]|nr:hypothetical protein B0H14DRAFT_2564334 [Mycena olivaceomarginata]
MHISLERVYVNNLPRREKASPSVEALNALDGSPAIRAAFAFKYSQGQALASSVHRLPVYFGILDTALVFPLDDPPLVQSPDAQDRITAAFYGLMAISKLLHRALIAVSALPDLWLRVWPWIQLLNIHEFEVQPILRTPMSALSVSMFFYFGGDHPYVTQIRCNSPGMAVLFVRASQRVLRGTPPLEYDPNLGRICVCLENYCTNGPPLSVIDDLILGAGGTPRDLALFLASILARLCPHVDKPPTPNNIDNLKYVVNFLSASVLSPSGASSELFANALVSRRPVKAFIHTLTSLTRTDPSHHAVPAFFGVFIHLLAIAPSSSGIMRSLREGLLPVIFACGAQHMSATRDFLIQFFKNILAPATVFHSVLCQLHIALSTLDNSQTAPMLALPEFDEIWNIILRILSVRLQTINPTQSRQCARFQVRPHAGSASTPLCGLFRPVLLFSNMSVRALERRTPSPLPIPQFVLSRDRHFLHALMLHEYKAHQQKITDQYQVVVNNQMIGNSWRDAPCITFDFRNGVDKIEIQPFRAVCPGLEDDATRRVVNAQYHLLVMRFVDGKEGRTLVYPVLTCQTKSPAPRGVSRSNANIRFLQFRTSLDIERGNMRLAKLTGTCKREIGDPDILRALLVLPINAAPIPEYELEAAITERFRHLIVRLVEDSARPGGTTEPEVGVKRTVVRLSAMITQQDRDVRLFEYLLALSFQRLNSKNNGCTYRSPCNDLNLVMNVAKNVPNGLYVPGVTCVRSEFACG